MSAMTMEEVAAYLRLSLNGVRRLIDDGKLPSYKVGRRRFVDSEALAAMLDNATRSHHE